MDREIRDDEMHLLKGRIAQAESQRDGWRAAGREEQYLEAYCRVEALELQLHQHMLRPQRDERATPWLSGHAGGLGRRSTVDVRKRFS